MALGGPCRHADVRRRQRPAELRREIGPLRRGRRPGDDDATVGRPARNALAAWRAAYRSRLDGPGTRQYGRAHPAGAAPRAPTRTLRGHRPTARAWLGVLLGDWLV